MPVVIKQHISAPKGAWFYLCFMARMNACPDTKSSDGRDASRSDNMLRAFWEQTAVKKLLAHGLFDFGDPVGTLEDFARLGAIGGADDAVTFHEVD